MTPRRILFTTFGSYGDLHPYLAIGLELRRRGHQVTIATSPAYRSKVESVGLRFHAVRPDIVFDDRAFLEKAFEPRKGTELIVRGICAAVRDTFTDTLAAAADADLLVTHALSYAAVMIAEKTGMLWVSTILSPINFLSAYDAPVLAPAPWLRHLRPLGPALFHFIYRQGRRIGWEWVNELVVLRKELRLPLDRHPLFEGTMSPSRVLALFSRELAAPQRDWPPQTVITGFPFFDLDEPLPPLVKEFLESGPPPLVFTLGSAATGAAGDFYRASLDTAQRLQMRALFLTGDYVQGLPDSLPSTMLAVPYAPHAEVFRRAAAIVHQGGVGTTAQAMRAGKPMLVVPFAHDQYDNAERVRRLGIAEMVPRPKYTPATAETKLRNVLKMSAAAGNIGGKISRERGAAYAADILLESSTPK